jgi:hypothetical protein
LNEKATCAKERAKVTMRASDAMITHGNTNTRESKHQTCSLSEGRRGEEVRKKEHRK